jgi:hypothetical protein
MFVGAGLCLTLAQVFALLGLEGIFIHLNLVTALAQNPWWSNLLILVIAIVFGQVVAWLMWIGMSDKGPAIR